MENKLGYKLGFIGAGNMAEAIARAAIDQNIVAPGQIIASDPTEARRQLFDSLGITVTTENAQVIAQAEQVILAVKPQMFPKVIDDLAAHVRSDQILISIMAGIGSEKISQMIGKPARIVRVMPNTPMLIGLGMSGIALGHGAQAGDDALAMQLFSAGGRAISVTEEQIDVITAVSGSGPAYVFYLAEAMQEAATKLGMPDQAELLASQTLLGAATLLAQSEDSAAELRRKVTSPKGTTQAAIEHMESHQIKQHLVDAMQKAWERSKELGQ